MTFMDWFVSLTFIALFLGYCHWAWKQDQKAKRVIKADLRRKERQV